MAKKKTPEKQRGNAELYKVKLEGRVQSEQLLIHYQSHQNRDLIIKVKDLLS